MSLREFLVGMALMSFALVTTKANAWPDFDEQSRLLGASNAAKRSINAPLPSAPSSLILEDKILGSAYYDTLNILKTNNRCSDFFRGTVDSVEVFNSLISKVRRVYLSASIGMRMSGRTISMVNMTTKNRYRLFDKVSINAYGPFYRRKYSNLDPSIPRVGTFEPNTKEARVLILLHELGHVMKGQDGNWLLPNDGQDEGLSRRNSQRIEDVCGDQIKSLGKAEATIDLVMHQQSDGNVTRGSRRAATSQ